MEQIASIAYAMICLGVVAFQIALIGGAPWGRLTQGGTCPGSLPVTRRAFAALSAVLMIGMGLAAISAAGLSPHWPRWTLWPVLAVQILSTVLNWITPSQPERQLWAPVTTLMLLLLLAVTLLSQ